MICTIGVFLSCLQHPEVYSLSSAAVIVNKVLRLPGVVKVIAVFQ